MLRLFSGILLIIALLLSILAYQRTKSLEKKLSSASQPGITNLLIRKDLQDAIKALDKGNKEEAKKYIERAMERLQKGDNPSTWDELSRKIDDIGKNIQDIWKYIYKGEKK
ncbi:hypothetical protein H5T87_09690 [bacterium]|nr:hypothetical protein [bacterium]